MITDESQLDVMRTNLSSYKCSARKCCVRLAAASLLLTLSGCISTPAQTTADVAEPVDYITPLLENRFGAKPEIASAAQLHQLTPGQAKAFHKFLDNPATAEQPLIRRVANYLERIGEGFTYDAATQLAQDTLSESSGNCMSLAVLTTALAEEAGVDVHYQLINSNPVFHWEGDLVRKGQHLRSMLLKPELEPSGFAFNRGGIQIDYWPAPSDRYVRNVARPGYLMMYYNNLAANALAIGDYNRAWWLTQESMQQQPHNIDALNVIAILYRRTGDEAHAERLYKAIIRENQNAVVILRNYRSLLRAQNRNAEARKITFKLSRLEGAHPVDWLIAGSEEFHSNNYKEAIRFYKKAIEIAPYMHEAHLGLARSYQALSKPGQTRYHLELAVAKAQRVSTRTLYEAKLASLGQPSENN